MKYAVFFVPHLKNRNKLSKIRAKLCRKYKNDENMQYPLHMTLALSVVIKNYKKFEQELKQLCAKEKPRILKADSKTDVYLAHKWSGIHLIETGWLKRFQEKIQKIVNKYAKKKEVQIFRPHISLVYGIEKPVNLVGLKPMNNPVKKFKFDRITICRQQKKGEKFKVFRHLRLG